MNKIKSTAALSSFFLLVSGCSIGPDYQQRSPENTVLSNDYHVQDTSAKMVTKQSLASKEWRTIHDDKQLLALIEEALAHNLDLETARANLKAASYYADASAAALWPWLDLALETSREKDSAGSYSTSNDLKAVLSWEVDLWGINRKKSHRRQCTIKTSRL